MAEDFLVGIAAIIILGIVGQWLAWRFRLPSILLLLIIGFLAGPATGLVNPDELLGELLFPVVSGSVAVILFEGGLSLRIAELREVGRAVRNLVSIGVLVTWVLSTVAAYFILGFDFALAIIFGAVLVVTGPTVIVPLLRHLRPSNRVGSVVKWEGIINDPIGAILAVLIFETILAGGLPEAPGLPVINMLRALLIGIVTSAVGAGLMIILLKRYWVPGFLQNGISLALVLAVFTVSDTFQAESGLLSVTLMGIILANQKWVTVKQIVEFKENLRVLLISGLFIILAARLQLETLATLGLHSFIFLAALILIVRPVSVFLSTLNTRLNWREKLFVSWMAPRGIVAAAVASIFALELSEEAGYVEAELMVAEMFLVIAGTVTVYGLTAGWVGRRLGVAQPNPQGVLIVGAHKCAQNLAQVLQAEGFQVLVVDNNRSNINEARLAGVPTFYASILSEYVLDEIELGGLGRLMALTPNDELNSLAALHFADVFDRTEVYQLVPKESAQARNEAVSPPLRGRLLFDKKATYSYLTERFNSGAVIKKTDLTEKFNFQAFKDLHGDNALPLFLIDELGKLVVFTADLQPSPQPGQVLISMIKEPEKGKPQPQEVEPEAVPAM